MRRHAASSGHRFSTGSAVLGFAQTSLENVFIICLITWFKPELKQRRLRI